MTDQATNPGENTVDQTAQAAATDTQAGTEVAAQSAETAAAPRPVRPEGLPDDLWDDAGGVKVGDLWAAHQALLAKQADVPAEGEAYDLALPEGFEVPKGLEVEIKADDPLWSEFQAIAQEAGVGRPAFGKFVAAFAKYQLAQQEADVAAYVAEKTRLGERADARITAADQWLKANLPKAQAEALGGALLSADAIQGLERIIALKSGPVAASNAGARTATEFDNLFGADRLAAIRRQQAA